MDPLVSLQFMSSYLDSWSTDGTRSGQSKLRYEAFRLPGVCLYLKPCPIDPADYAVQQCQLFVVRRCGSQPAPFGDRILLLHHCFEPSDVPMLTHNGKVISINHHSEVSGLVVEYATGSDSSAKARFHKEG